MELIFFIIIMIVVVTKNSAKKEGRKEVVPNQSRTQAVPNQVRRQTAASTQYSTKSAAQLKEEIWTRLSEESKAKMQNIAPGQRTSGIQPMQAGKDMALTTSQQIQKRRMEEKTTSILDRAKGNAAEWESDVTLNTMEAEHKHSERVAPAVHNHPEDIIPENMLGDVADLMVKGFDGNLCFERDFVGEGLDMISRFIAPSEVPDYSMPGSAL